MKKAMCESSLDELTTAVRDLDYPRNPRSFMAYLMDTAPLFKLEKEPAKHIDSYSDDSLFRALDLRYGRPQVPVFIVQPYVSIVTEEAPIPPMAPVHAIFYQQLAKLHREERLAPQLVEFHASDLQVEIHEQGTFTIATVFTAAGELLSIGVAKQNPEDEYDPYIGIRAAIGRALTGKADIVTPAKWRVDSPEVKDSRQLVARDADFLLDRLDRIEEEESEAAKRKSLGW